MIVGIAEIKALAAGRPIHFAFNLDTLCEQALFPRGEILFRDREREVQLAGGSVRRDHAAGRGNRLRCAAASENEEYLLVRDAEYAEAFAGFQQAESQLILVETNRAGKIVGEQTGFDDAIDARGGHDRFSSRLKKEILYEVYPVPFGAAMAIFRISRQRAIRFHCEWTVLLPAI